ncbi:MAG TPA: sugar transferase [Terracidiphilus sp.]|nr:sugar transferase [Terracidiphilus sp.]
MGENAAFDSKIDIGDGAATQPDSDQGPGWLPEPSRGYQIAKRALDLVLSLAFLILWAPLLLLIVIAIKLDSPGPVLFRQQRVGLRGKLFTLWKFRTMHIATDSSLRREYVQKLIEIAPSENASQQPHYALRNDPRITRVGRLLRRLSFDEFPQFVSVLAGDMSLVGPRPALHYEVAAYQEWHKLRFSCKPGITGLGQVSGRSRLSFDEMVRLDIYYANHSSIWRDLKILLRTPFAVLGDPGAY